MAMAALIMITLLCMTIFLLLEFLGRSFEPAPRLFAASSSYVFLVCTFTSSETYNQEFLISYPHLQFLVGELMYRDLSGYGK